MLSSTSSHHSCRRLLAMNRQQPPSLPRLTTTKLPSFEGGSSSHDNNSNSNSQEGRPPQQYNILSRKKMISLAAKSLQQQGDHHFTMTSSSQQQERQQSQHQEQQQHQSVLTSGQPLPASPPVVIHSPAWTVAARGESRLEPVCETANVQRSVDLTSQASFLIGRSPACDVQLFHETASRRHALLFHHPNGSCYIADCGSVHGTYVNGVRVRSPQADGKVLPHRVKRGALIRFGSSVGAPSFVLKSFHVSFDSLAKTVTGKTMEHPVQVLEETSADCDGSVVSRAPTLAPSKATKFLIQQPLKDDVSLAGLVRFNTRMNAFGGPSALTPSNLSTAKKTLETIMGTSSHNEDLQQLLKHSPTVLKRSFDQIDDQLTAEPQPLKKRCQMMSTVTPLNMEDSIMPIVSPTRTSRKITLSFPQTDLTPNPYTTPLPLFTVGPKRTMKKVTFSDEKPQDFFPPSVTPDASSDDEDCQYSSSADLTGVQLPTRVSLLPPRTPRVSA